MRISDWSSDVCSSDLNLFSTPIPDDKLSAKAQFLIGNYDSRKVHGWLGGWTPLGGGLEVGAIVEGLYERSDGFKRLDNGGNTGFAFTDRVAKLGVRTTAGRHALAFKYQNYDETSHAIGRPSCRERVCQ